LALVAVDLMIADILLYGVEQRTCLRNSAATGRGLFLGMQKNPMSLVPARGTRWCRFRQRYR
jgi:hypothetical protein